MHVAHAGTGAEVVIHTSVYPLDLQNHCQS